LAMLLGMLMAGCGGKDKMVLKTHEEKWANGQVRIRYTYYLDDAGERVYHGKKTEWAEDGHRRLELEFRNGKRDGLLVEWYPDGQKTRQGRWASDRETGVWTGWQPTGDKAWECTYQDGKIVGKKTFWRDGKVSVEEIHDASGRKVETIRWHANGQKAVHGHFSGGRKHGPWTHWDEDGNIEAEGRWRDGKPWNGLCAIPAAGDAGSWAGITKFVRYREGEPIGQE